MTTRPDCPQCLEISDDTVNTGRGEQFVPAFYALEPFSLHDRAFRRCTACGAYFHWTDDPQLYGSGNLDEQSVERLAPDVSALLDRILRGDPKRPPGADEVAEHLRVVPLALLVEALGLRVFRAPEVVAPFVPELVGRLGKGGEAIAEIHDLLRNYRYRSPERAKRLLATLDDAGAAGWHADSLREKCRELLPGG